MSNQSTRRPFSLWEMFRYVFKYLTLCVICPLIPHPRLRAYYLAMLGARVGRRVRVEDVVFIQLHYPLRNLNLRDDAYVGSQVILDLARPLTIGARTAISPRCTLLTHQDFVFTGSRLVNEYPARFAPVEIGDDVAVGADTTVLCGSRIGDFSVVGAKSLVRGALAGGGVYIGIPATRIKDIGPATGADANRLPGVGAPQS